MEYKTCKSWVQRESNTDENFRTAETGGGCGFESVRTVIALAVHVEQLKSVSDGCVNQAQFQSAVKSTVSVNNDKA